MKYRITASNPQGGNIMLPASKSISNRLLIMDALSGMESTIENLAECDDTKVLQNALTGTDNAVDIHGAGTAMRFLTAYYACTNGTHTLTGSQRMQQRPIGLLVDALRQVGANISYLQAEGFPPLLIKGTTLQGGKIIMQGNVSSQYISALLLVAPYMQDGLQISFAGSILSEPYIRMTVNLMSRYGATVKWDKNTITVDSGFYRPVPMRVESDWSAASYWYEIAALSQKRFTLAGLQRESLQGDARTACYFADLGIQTIFTADGVQLVPSGAKTACFSAELSNEPDIAQTLALTCALLEIPFRLEGLHNLRIKESDRIAALQNEAAKLGYIFTTPANGVLAWDGTKTTPMPSPYIHTYEDHRMAMAFAPAALKRQAVIIDNPTVVGKSYPQYWTHLQQAGFSVSGTNKEKESA